MKSIIILWILTVSVISGFAQSLVSTSGGSHQNSQGKMVWSMGEPVVNCFATPQGILNQGFQQGNQLAVMVSSSDINICSGEQILIEAISTGGGPNHSYLWTSNPAGLNSPSAVLSVSPNISTWYFVEVSDGGISPNVIDSIFITVNSNHFNIAFTANPQSFTSQPFQTAITNQTPAAANYQWHWNLGDGSQSYSINPIHTFQYNGLYTISAMATDTTTGCYDTLVKYNYINCQGGSVNPCTLVANISPSGGATICSGDSLKLSATYNQNANYQWIRNGIIMSGKTDSILFAKDVGMYQVMLSDSICSVFSGFFNLTQFPVSLPIITSNGSITPCTNDSMELIASSGFANYLWNNGQAAASIWVHQSGNYVVNGENIFGCIHFSQPFTVNASMLSIPEICIVGVDSATNKNRIIWQRETNPLIDSFRIYRETFVANQYQLIGSKAFSDQSLFIDQNSNPTQQAYRYKITAVDTCGAETPLSNYHKTNHLTINAGMNGSWNLIWDGYQGFNFGSYRIYRGVDSLNLQFIAQIQSTLTSYTDLNPPVGKLYYLIEVVSPHPCYPDSILSKAQTNYNTSRSNVTNTAAAPNIGFNYSESNGIIKIYPNPNDGNFTLELHDLQNIQSRELNIKIFNALGAEVFADRMLNEGQSTKTLNLSFLAKGVYYLQLTNNLTLIHTHKLIIQ